MTVRTVLAALALAFAVYQAARGLIWTAFPERPGILIAALIIYVTATVVTIFAIRGPGPERRHRVSRCRAGRRSRRS